MDMSKRFFRGFSLTSYVYLPIRLMHLKYACISTHLIFPKKLQQKATTSTFWLLQYVDKMSLEIVHCATVYPPTLH